MKTSAQIRKEFVENPFAWPGGYPIYAITDDGAAICRHCAESESESIDDAYPRDGWYLVALQINWNDCDLVCDNCLKPIESAYCDEVAA
jgi:hypothetical protein